MNIYKRHRFSPDIISYAVWRYFRFNLSHRDIEDLLAQRGITVSYESIRLWCIKFGQRYARWLKRRHQGYGDTFFIDEVFVKINGKQHYRWCTVDQESLPQAKRMLWVWWGCRCVSPGAAWWGSGKAIFQTFAGKPWWRTRENCDRQFKKLCRCSPWDHTWHYSRYVTVCQLQGGIISSVDKSQRACDEVIPVFSADSAIPVCPCCSLQSLQSWKAPCRR